MYVHMQTRRRRHIQIETRMDDYTSLAIESDHKMAESHKQTYIYSLIHIRIHVYIFIHIYMYTYRHTHIYVYIYIYIYICNRLATESDRKLAESRQKT